MTGYDWSKCSEPTELVGEWSKRHDLSFRDARDPLAVKCAIEKTTGTLLTRDVDDPVGLVFRGMSGGHGDVCRVRLALRAVIDGLFRYDLTVEQTKPRRWLTESRFEADCVAAAAYRAAKLDVVTDEMPWSRASAAEPDASIHDTVEEDLAAATRTEDPMPVAALKREVIESMRCGWTIRDAHKEGGSCFSFDGARFHRVDYGDGPDRSASWPDEASMLAALIGYFDWETRSPTWPHPPLQRNGWQFLRDRLSKPSR